MIDKNKALSFFDKDEMPTNIDEEQFNKGVTSQTKNEIEPIHKLLGRNAEKSIVLV